MSTAPREEEKRARITREQLNHAHEICRQFARENDEGLSIVGAYGGAWLRADKAEASHSAQQAKVDGLVRALEDGIRIMNGDRSRPLARLLESRAVLVAALQIAQTEAGK